MAGESTEDKQIYLSADLACRLAAIDIGSNSVRLLVAEALRGGTYRILDEEREPTRLGRSASAEGRLDDTCSRGEPGRSALDQLPVGLTALGPELTCDVHQGALRLGHAEEAPLVLERAVVRAERADQPGAENCHPRHAVEPVGKAHVVVEVVDREHVGSAIAFEWQTYGVGAQGEGFVRLTVCADKARLAEAVERMKKVKA